MTPLFGSRRRAEAFAVRLDAGATGPGPAAGGPDSAADPEIEALVGLVAVLRSGPVDEQATPRAEFSADLRDRLVTEAVAVLSQPAAAPPAPVRPHGRRERRLAAAATVAVLLGGSAGMATAAQGALPGDALYPVKRGIEKAAVSLSGSKVGQGRELLSQAGDRLREVEGLMKGGSPERAQIPRTLEDFHAEARKGATLMVESYESTENPRTMMFLRSFAVRKLGTVESLTGTAPSDAQPGLRDAALLLRSVISQADQLCPTCWQPSELESATLFPASAGSSQARHELLTVDPLSPKDGHSLLLEEASNPTLGLSAEELAATDPGVLEPSGGPEPTGGTDGTDGTDGAVQVPEQSAGDGDSPVAEPEPGQEPTDGEVDPSPAPDPGDPETDPGDTETDPGEGPGDDPSTEPGDDDQGDDQGKGNGGGQGEEPSDDADGTGTGGHPSGNGPTGGSEETTTSSAADQDASVLP